MPMFTTWVIRSSARTRSANAAIWSSTAWTSGTTSTPSTTIDEVRGARSATCITARSSVTLMCSPANIASRRCLDTGAAGNVDQTAEHHVVDELLRPVDVQVGDLDHESIRSTRVGGEELAQVRSARKVVKCPERVGRVHVSRRYRPR